MVEKTERITVRFTPEGEEWVVNQAEKAGVSKGRYLRQVALCQRPQAEEPFDDTNKNVALSNGVRVEELRKVLHQDLSKIGSNLNQIAKHINKQSKIGIKQTHLLKDMRDNWDSLVSKIVRAIR